MRAFKPIPIEKICIDCQRKLSADNFSLIGFKTSTGRTGNKLRSCCKSCYSLRGKAKRVLKGRKPPHPVDQPRVCKKCKILKEPDNFWKRLSLGINKVPTLDSVCHKCKFIDAKRRADADPERYKKYRHVSRQGRDKAKWAAYAAEYFQDNKEKIRLRNIEFRKKNPEKMRARYIAAIYKRRAFCDKREPVIREAIQSCLESYRIGDMYWDVYDSCLIEKPTIDHVLAVSRGGTNSMENFCVTSTTNNSSKNAQPLLVWLAKRAAKQVNAINLRGY